MIQESSITYNVYVLVFITPFAHIFFYVDLINMLINILNSLEFLNQVIPDRKIIDLEFVDKEMHHVDRSRKDSIYDMFCKTDDGSRIVVEVQRRKQANFAERAIYYSTFSIANQVSAGAGCYDFYPVYVISILNFGFKPGGSKVKSEFRLYETDTRELLTDRVTLIFLDSFLIHF